MQTVSGLLGTYVEATAAVHALNDAGIRTADISLIANNAEGLYPGDANAVGKDTAAGAEVGAVLGGAGGLLAGLGLFAIPALGPVIGGGWLLATIMGAVAGAGLGAATGGLIGLLTGAGIPRSDAHVYAEGVRRGGALVSARVADARAEEARAILKSAGAADLDELRRSYEEEGWKGFDETHPDAETASIEDYRDRYPLVPPVI